MAEVAWGDEIGLDWDGADDATRERWALARLFWFFRMVDSGGPDGSDLDTLVYDEGREAAEWYGPRLQAQAEVAGKVDL